VRSFIIRSDSEAGPVNHEIESMTGPDCIAHRLLDFEDLAEEEENRRFGEKLAQVEEGSGEVDKLRAPFSCQKL
jgi:hypothetical protein